MPSEPPTPAGSAVRGTACLLIIANLIPLAGVLIWSWSLFHIVALYWVENVIIGGLNLVKMLVSSPSHPGEQQPGLNPARQPRPDRTGNNIAKVFIMPFFTFHYGLFCLVHGALVLALLGHESMGIQGGVFAEIKVLLDRALADGGLLTVTALAGSHLVSFVRHFLIGGEFRRTSALQLMGAPYGRIFVLHIAILFGAGAVVALGQPIFLLVLLVAGKIMLDLGLHVRSHTARIAAEVTK